MSMAATEMASTRHAAIREFGAKTVISDWRLEVASCLVAFISLLATIVTLFPHANNPLPQWPFHVSINTLLSIYTVVFKATLISVLSVCVAQLQWTWFSVARPLSDLLGYDEASRDAWGALKWLLNYRLREPLTAFAAFLMILSLAIDPFIQQLVVIRDCETPLREANATILPKTGSIENNETFNQWVIGTLESSYTNPSRVSSSLVCPTGNCTFPTQYSTLAYCSSCIDVSNKVSVHVTGSPQTEERYFTTLGSTGLFSPKFKTISSFSTANATLSTNMTFLNAKVNDVALEQRSRVGVLSDFEVSLLMSTNYFSTRRWDPFKTKKMKDGCLFRAGTPNFQYSLQCLFDQPVTANYIWDSDGNNVHPRAVSFSGAPQLLSIFNNGNISFRRVSGTFSNIADSMTDYVRTHGDRKYSAPAKGIAWHYATCLEVHWPWIIFPFALYICTVALLGAVAVSTSKSRRPIWKLSLLAWIYHGAARDFGPDSIPGLEVESMRERAKQHVVVLGGNDDLRIRMVEPVKEPMPDRS
ncbi:hypothetical protein EKO27_g3339 [Xylaria grammica]|uniref:Uncharacterized protein n=1 Tax=Xylaria grammica TaxID=363999 RepID=A0A439DBJ0_9PEZI|nr:hypothetical protein EKO27_g3339 [Xylaria grammica]